MNKNIETKAADNIRILAAAMVEKAKSGHPGGAMGGADFIHTLFSEFLNYDPSDMTWIPDEEMLKMKNVISVPHLGASTKESETNCAIMAVKQVKDYLENGNIVNSVNFPAATMERNGGCRLLITNKNIPTMVSQISKVLGDAGLNIDNMLNKKYDEIAYNIIDLAQKNIDESISDKLKAIEGIITVRIIHS